MLPISLGYSPCPNDTFIFYALVHGKIGTDDIRFSESLLDIETLNNKAFDSELDVTKISFHAFGHLRNDYCLLRAGGALGRGCGPLVITKHDYSMDELHDRKIAVPGKYTTAFLLYQLYSPSPVNPSYIVEMPFNEIIRAVAEEEVDAGLVIHESRFTYRESGLRQILDLGQWWEKETGLPIPLGGIIAKRSLGKETINKIDALLKTSIDYAFQHRDEPLSYIRKHSQELSDNVIQQHIELYVNDLSLDPGEEGSLAIKEFLTRAEKAGIIPESVIPLSI